MTLDVNSCTIFFIILFTLKRIDFVGQKFVNPSKVERWAVANFSARCDVNGLVRDLIKVGEMKGIVCSASLYCAYYLPYEIY